MSIELSDEEIKTLIYWYNFLDCQSWNEKQISKKDRKLVNRLALILEDRGL